jgi:hypothetical protein
MPGSTGMMAPGRYRLNAHQAWANGEDTAARLVRLRPVHNVTLLLPLALHPKHQAEEYVFAAAYLNFLIDLIVIPMFPLFNGHDKAPSPSGRLLAPAARRRPQDPQPCKKLLPHLHTPCRRVSGPVSIDADLGFHFEAIGG